ncbi:MULTISPECIES: NAD(P)H-dependent oxidoreductase [unclassified Lactobacillus]|uniref:NAD(P)H-dependent oxidoreductase n=1 Tax=unclassified Lactobacillus TaxID=2620435 RepID=UPI001E46AB6D|nr:MULTISPECIES: NAD(P)H-dependent oxidoreductase [unclassified Lactobacillus]
MSHCSKFRWNLIYFSNSYAQIFTKVQQILKARKEEFSAIDLYWDNFNPAYDARKLSLFKAGKTSDPNVKKYQKLLKEANRRIFIFPVWWNDTPAIIKGFIDKVMKKKFAYNVGATGVIGHLRNIQRVEVMTTLPHPPGI